METAIVVPYVIRDELADVIETIQSEVSQYKEGKYSDELIELPTSAANQTSILDQLNDDDFDNAKV